MKLLRIYDGNINQRFIDEAVEALRQGELIVYPTDTLYAIGCDALNNKAIERLCKIKGINPLKQTLSIAGSDMSQVSEYARIDNRAFSTMKRYLPGPYTFLLPAATTLPKLFKGRKIVGVRIPDNDIVKALAETLEHPLLTTSVMTEGLHEDEYTEPEELGIRYDSVASLLIDGGRGGSVPSTVIDLTDSSSPVVVREGKGDFDE